MNSKHSSYYLNKMKTSRKYNPLATKKTLNSSTNIFTNRYFTFVVLGILFLFYSTSTFAQSNGDYRTKQSGNWNATATWQTYNGTAWVNASATPTSANGAINILNGHVVTITASVTVDQTTVNSGGQITINSGVYLRLNAGTGDDLIVNGTIINYDNSSGYNGFRINAGATIIFNAGGLYTHAVNGGTIPTATWNGNSTCLVTGTTNTVPGGLTQTFGNFTWSCTGQTGAISLAGALTTINGNLKLLSTNNQELRLIDTGTATTTIGGDLEITGGILDIHNSAQTNTTTLNIGGSLSISGGTLLSGNTTTPSTINFTGAQSHYSLTGGTFTTTYINFNVNSGATLTLNNNLSISTGRTMTVLSGGTLSLGSFASSKILNGAGNLTLSSGGTIEIGDPYGILTGTATGSTAGSVQVTGTRSYNTGASYVYDGNAAQNTGNGLPTTVNNLTFDNNKGVTFNNTGNTTSVSGILTLTRGIVTASGGISVTNTSTSSVIGGQSVTFINGALKRSLPANLTSGSTYNYPVGNGTTYLPFSLVNPTTGTGATTAQITATLANPGGTNGTGISSKSSTEYWTLTTSGNYTNSSASAYRQSAINPYNVLATSATQTGSYANTGGTTEIYGVSSSNATGNKFFVLAESSVPTLNVSTSVLYGFNYTYGNGPSSSQSFNVSGTALTNNITVTPGTNYEISTQSDALFQSTAITLTRDVNNNVNTTLYVRLKSGLAINNYISTITVASSGLTSKTINNYGTVTPTLTIGGGGSYCEGSTINLTSSSSSTLTNQYWTGPNNFYSQVQNPSIPNATIAMSGTYSVVGNITSGVNLVTNGDFSSGNTGFISSYIYSNNLNPEGNYYITTLPVNVHSNFNSVGDHTTGTGNQMVVNGATVVDVNIWSPSTPITVVPYTNYQFSYWIQTVVNGTDANPANLELSVNGVVITPVFAANAQSGIWTKFIYNWYSGTSSSANLSLTNQQTGAGGNDFALDDIRFEQVYTTTASTNVQVVSPTTPASVSVSASQNPANSGTNVTYTATPTNGGTNPTYQWSVNGTPIVGATGSTYNYIPANGDVVTCTMTSNSTCYVGGPVSSSVTMTVNTAVNYWRGTLSTDWGNPANWTENYVPNQGDNVIFASTSNGYGSNAINDLTLDIDRTVGNLTNLCTNGKKLIIPAGKILVVNNTMTTNGDPNSILIQASTTATNGSLKFTRPALNTSVQATVEMYNKAFKGAAITWTDDLHPSYPNNTYTTSYRWQYLGIPVQSMTANPTFYGSYVRVYGESTNGNAYFKKWTDLTTYSPMTPFKGYEVTQESPKLITFQGALVVGDQTLTLNVSGGSNFYGAGYNIFGNSFVSAIDITKMIFPASLPPNGVEQTVYLYNTGSFGEWAQGVTTGGSYTAVPVNTASAVAKEISSMQGFLLKASSTTYPKSYTVTIPYNATTNSMTKNTTLQRAKGIEKAKGDVVIPIDQSFTEENNKKLRYLKIEVSSDSAYDCTWIFNNDSTSHLFDNGWDGYKLMGVKSTCIFSEEDEVGSLQVNTMDVIDSVYLYFMAGENKTQYTLNIQAENILDQYDNLFLFDLKTGASVKIEKDQTSYVFSAENITMPEKRFLLSGTKKDLTKIVPFKVSTNLGKVSVKNIGDEVGTLYIYDATGKMIASSDCPSQSVTSVSCHLMRGVYLTSIITQKGKKYNQKIVIK